MNRIEIRLKAGQPDVRGQGLVKDILDLGIRGVTDVRVDDIYWLDADLKPADLEIICFRLLSDPIVNDYEYDAPPPSPKKGTFTVEVAYNAGVVDPVEQSVLKAIEDLGYTGVRAVKTAKRYIIEGKISKKDLELACSRLLVNPIIQHAIVGEQFAFPRPPEYVFKLETVNITKDPDVLKKRFGFTEDEAKTILAYYKKLKKSPTDAELETIAQTWSEHCVHKTFRGKINFNGEIINNLLKTTIMKATRALNKPWCLSVFLDNSGVIEFDDKYAVCFKVETHNHPSAVEPYGGAATGIGGVVRDPLGTGLGSKPICNTDVFCFGPPDMDYDKLPPGVLHPRRVFKGVRAGVADYGNRLGIPTLNGAILFDERYVGNPLVYCGTVGLMPKEHAMRGQQKPGDVVVVVGGQTGRDGIHGVNFASEELTDKSTTVSFTSVQIGNAIVEKKVIDTLLQARDRGLYDRITDVGGGGLSSAVGEMGSDTGVKVDLDKVPLKYAGLNYSEIWISESQERMILAVPREKADELLKLFAAEDVEASIIGEFTNDKRLQLFYKGHRVADVAMEFLHEGWPQIERTATWSAQKPVAVRPVEPKDFAEPLLKILGSWNVCSKEWVIRQYDHEVQGASVLKPLVGEKNDGPGDASIIRPRLDSDKGLIVSSGINTRYGDLDAYWMACSVIDEALRQVVAVGGNLDRVALLDNFCWGNTGRPEVLGALVRAAQACHDMSMAYGIPFISGKDSLNNEFRAGETVIGIPHTLLVSAMGVMPDVNRAISMDFKKAGNLIYILGGTYDELGGSEYYALHKLTGGNVPVVDPVTAKEQMIKLSKAMSKGLVKSCHDCSDGGLGVAVAEMAFAGGLGASINLKDVPYGEEVYRDDIVLFSESNSRFLVEVEPAKQAKFEIAMRGTTFGRIGEVTASPQLLINGAKKTGKVAVADLKEAWQRPLRW